MDFQNQSIELEDGSRQSALMPKGELLYTFFDDVTTLYESFQRGLRISEERPLLGTVNKAKDGYDWLTFKQVFDDARKIGSGLGAKGFTRQEGGFLGIFASNSPKWVIAEQACNMYSYVVIPLYDTLGAEACDYIINNNEIHIVFVDTLDKAKSLLVNHEQIPTLQTIILGNAAVTDEISELSKKADVQVMSWEDLLELGANNIREADPPKPEEMATICYTSGTTGNPKGVVLSHKNLISDVSSCLLIWEKLGVTVDHNDVHISYLPLAHMYERLCQAAVYQIGGRVGFFGGDVKNLLNDIVLLKPTIFPGVPRLLNRIYDKVQADISQSWIKSSIFHFCLNRKLAEVTSGTIRKDSWWDKLVFRKMHAMMGGNVRIMITGSAPLSPEVFNFCRAAFGCYFMEGYGQTEATAACTVTYPGDTEIGHVGPPIPSNFVKVVDVPEMNYFAKDKHGEVCVKGPNVMSGYYMQPEKTAEAIDSDGWLHTGDIGQWLPNGAMKIFDRRKHIFKLAQGEYIAPEKIEQIYVRSPLIAQIFVDGNSLKSSTIGIAVPDPDTFVAWAAKHGHTGDISALCKLDAVKDAVMADINDVGRNAGLKSFELVRGLVLWPELFSVENNLLTPTFKAKRNELRKMFAKQIDEMYSHLQ